MALSDSRGWRRSRFVFFCMFLAAIFFYVLGSCTLSGFKTARRRRHGPDRQNRIVFPVLRIHLSFSPAPRGGPARPGGSEYRGGFSNALNRYFCSFFSSVGHSFGIISDACRRTGSRCRAAASEHSPVRAESRAARHQDGAARLPAAAAELFFSLNSMDTAFSRCPFLFFSSSGGALSCFVNAAVPAPWALATRSRIFPTILYRLSLRWAPARRPVARRLPEKRWLALKRLRLYSINPHAGAVSNMIQKLTLSSRLKQWR